MYQCYILTFLIQNFYLEILPSLCILCVSKRYVDSGEMMESFPYRAKAIFAWEEIDGRDIMFFGMHVQEYGSECPGPNTRSFSFAF